MFTVNQFEFNHIVIFACLLFNVLIIFWIFCTFKKNILSSAKSIENNNVDERQKIIHEQYEK